MRDERAKLVRERERETVRGFTEWPTLDELKDSCLYLGSSTGLNHFLCSPSGHAKKPGDSFSFALPDEGRGFLVGDLERAGVVGDSRSKPFRLP